MKVFYYSGNLIYNYGTKVEFQGYFIKNEDEEIKGYLEERKGNRIIESAIKGLYSEVNSQILFVKTSAPGESNPEIYIFENSFKDGWVSSYHRIYKAFSVNGGVRNAKAKINSFREIFEAKGGIGEKYSEFIEKRYRQCYANSTSLSKALVENIEKYKWLFSFVKHLKGSAK